MAGHPRDLAHGVALFLKKTNVHELIQIEHGSLWLSGDRRLSGRRYETN
jgi:hypothetical protein